MTQFYFIILLIINSFSICRTTILQFGQTYGIDLPGPIYSMKQLSNQRMVIQYKNSSFFLYENNFIFVQQFTRLSGVGQIRHYYISADNNYVTAIKQIDQNGIKNNVFLYSISQALIIKRSYITGAILFYFEPRIPEKILFVFCDNLLKILRTNANDITQILSTANIAYPIGMNSIVDCVLGQNDNYLKNIYCYTSLNDIVKINLDFDSSLIFQGITIIAFYLQWSANIVSIFNDNQMVAIYDSNNRTSVFYNNQYIPDTNYKNSLLPSKLLGLTFFQGKYYFMYYYGIIIFQQTFIGGSADLGFVYNIMSYNFGNQSKFLTSYSPKYKFNDIIIDNFLLKMYKLNPCISMGTYYDVSNNICVTLPCINNLCLQCPFHPNLCQTCQQKIGFYLHNTFYCDYKPCPEYCRTCIQNQACTSCQSDFYIHEGTNKCITKFIIQIDKRFNYFDQEFKVGCSFLKAMNYYPGLRNYLPFLLPFFSFFDDYWYYLYQKNFMNRLQYTTDFFILLYQASKDRLFPNFPEVNLQNVQSSVTVDENIVNKYRQFTDSRVFYIDQQETYFWYNSRGFIVYHVSIVTLTTLLFKITLLIFNNYYIWKIKVRRQIQPNDRKINFEKDQENLNKSSNKKKQKLKRSKIVQLLLKFLNQNISIKNYIQALFSGSLIFFSFSIGLQMKMLGYLQKATKFNSFLTIFCGFFLLTFAIVFNLNQNLIFENSQPSNKKNIPNNQLKINKLKLQNDQIKNFILVGLKNVLIGFIQGFLINFNQNQLFCLIIIKLFILTSIFFLEFKIWILRYIKFFYFFSSLLIDILLFLSSKFLIDYYIDSNILHIQTFQNIEFTIIILMVSFVILDAFIDVLLQLRNAFKQLFKQQPIKNQQQRQKKFVQNNQIEVNVLSMNKNKILQQLRTKKQIRLSFNKKIQVKSIDKQKFFQQQNNESNKLNPNGQKIRQISHFKIKKINDRLLRITKRYPNLQVKQLQNLSFN